mgnify:CR=1 FL=1
MWAVIKLKNIQNKLNVEKSLIKLIGSDVKFYAPKIQIDKKIKNQHVKKECFVLGNYIFIYHKRILDKLIFHQINFTRGLDCFLDGFKSCQSEIVDFINKCKILENSSGYLTQDFFKIFSGDKVKFNSGPFASYISEVIRVESKKINLLIGNYSLVVKKKNYLLSLV